MGSGMEMEWASWDGHTGTKENFIWLRDMLASRVGDVLAVEILTGSTSARENHNVCCGLALNPTPTLIQVGRPRQLFWNERRGPGCCSTGKAKTSLFPDGRSHAEVCHSAPQSGPMNLKRRSDDGGSAGNFAACDPHTQTKCALDSPFAPSDSFTYIAYVLHYVRACGPQCSIRKLKWFTT
jgi:hypothetical protein